jgi:dTDP-4-dehydrorhamnose reductase
MNKVLVLGASGLLGRYACAELSAAGLSVCAQSRAPGGACDQVFDPAVPEMLRERLAAIRPGTIVNTAALTNVDFCEDHVAEAYRVNVAVAETLAQWVSENDPSCHLIQISTDQLYARAGFQTEAAVDVLNVYALTKYGAELALRTVPRHTILRTNFFGRSLTAGRESFSDWIHQALLHSTPIRLATDIEFNPVSLKTLARCIAAVAVRPETGTFNVGSCTALSKHAFGMRFAQAVSLAPTCITACSAAQLAFRVRRPLDMRMDVGRFEGLQGRMPALEEEIERTADDYRRGKER